MDDFVPSTPIDSPGGASKGRRPRGGNGRTRTPRKDGTSNKPSGSNPGQDEGDVWELPALGEDRKEALNWQQTLTSSSPQGKSNSNGRSRKQPRPALPRTATSAPPLAAPHGPSHGPFVDPPTLPLFQEAPTWQQALFAAPAPSRASQTPKSAPALPAGVLPAPPVAKSSNSRGKGRRRNSLNASMAQASLAPPSTSLDTSPSSTLASFQTVSVPASNTRSRAALPNKPRGMDFPPHLAPPPTAPAAMRSASLPSEEAAAMYAGPDYHSSPAPEDIPRPRFPPRVR